MLNIFMVSNILQWIVIIIFITHYKKTLQFIDEILNLMIDMAKKLLF